MATTNSKSGSDLRTPADIVCEFIKGVKDERALHESQREASIIKIERSEMARGYKLCTLDKTEETWDFYHDLNNYELFDFKRSTEIIKTDIDTDAKADDELGKLIQAGSKLLKDLKTGLQEANNLSCTMRNCLQSIIGFGDDHVPAELKEVTDLARSLSDSGQKGAKAMVEIAGIHTFANLNRLKPFSDSLQKAAQDLFTSTDENVKKAAAAAIDAQKDVTTVVDELNSEEFACFEETSALNAIHGTTDYLCGEASCPPIGSVDDICKGMSAEETGSTNYGQARQGKYAAGDES